MNDINTKEIVQESHQQKSFKRVWLSPVITTIISILVAVGLTWYQIDRVEREDAAAEIERVKSVRTTMVAIVEDHVVNNQPIDIPRLSRLIEVKSREVGIQSNIRLLEVIQLAELNILNSGYLDFKTKEEYKKVFDTIYKSLRNEYQVNHSDVKHAPLIEEIVKGIKLGNPEDSVANLQLLIEAYSTDIKTLESKQKHKDPVTKIIKAFDEEPFLVIGASVVYIIFLILFFPRMKRILRRIIEE